MTTPGRLRRAIGSLPPTVVALGWASLLTDLSSEMIYPLLPVFLLTVLGAGPVALGLVEGLAESAAALLKITSGYLTDRSGRRKPLIVGGYGLSGSARPLIGLAAAWPLVAALRFLDRIGKGFRTSPRDALIADVTPAERRGAAFGLHRAMDHAGAVAGPLVAAGLLLLGLPLRSVFVLAAIPGVAVVTILLVAVREDRSEAPSAPRRSEAHPVRFGADFKRMMVAVTVFTLGNSTDAFLLVRFGDAGLAAGWVAVLWALHNGVKMVANWFGGALSDRVGRKRPIIFGWVLYGLVYAGFAATDRLGPLIALFMVYGLYYGLTEPVERSWVASLAPPGARGTAFGWYNGAVGLAALPASLLFGLLYAGVGPGVAFLTGAGLAAGAAVIIATVADPPSVQSG